MPIDPGKGDRFRDSATAQSRHDSILESAPERDLDLLSLEHQLTEAKIIASME